MARVNFSLTQLEYALAVHRHGNISLAAKACHVTQPTLSMQLGKLEEELGVVLFDRSKKPILMTDQGRKLIEQMQSVLSEARKIEGILEEEASGVLAGSLTVGIIPTVAPYLLPRLLPMVEKLYPKLELQIREMQTHRIVEALDADEIDVGILAIPLGETKLKERGLYWEPFSVLCQKGHELARKKKVDAGDMDPEEIWLLEEGHCLRAQVLDVCDLRKGKRRQFQFESGSLETLKNLVSSYGGYTLLPELATGSLPEGVVLRGFSGPVPAREIGFVTRREHHKTALLNALAISAVEGLPEALRKLKKKDLELIPVE